MICSIIIPIIDNGEIEVDENLKYEVLGRYDGNNSDKMYADGADNVLNAMYSQPIVSDNYEVSDINHKIRECICECNITDADNRDIDALYIEDIAYNGKMSILRVNINPNTVDDDCETELKFWFDDSNKLLGDKTVDKQTKLKHLPVKTLKLSVKGKTYALKNCKMFRQFKDVDNAPMFVALLIEQITCC